MATLTVSNLSDSGVSGDGSLRGEILAAAAGDTVIFQTGLSGPINLGAAKGQLSVTQNLTITGPGAGVVTINGQNGVRDIGINAGTTVTISGLTISGGNAAAGGGILNSGTLTLQNCTVSGNTANGNANGGGGIHNSGTLTLQHCTVSGNTANGNADGGAGIDSFGTATLLYCTVTGNTAIGTNEQGGGIENAGTLTVQNCIVTNNTASGTNAGQGGGIFCGGGGTIALLNSTVSGNKALSTGGNFADGGGLFVGSATLQGSTVSGNTVTGTTSVEGGGIYSTGPLTVQSCTISGNTGSASAATSLALGGGIFGPATMTVQNSTIYGNAISGNGANVGGGGISTFGSTITVLNSTISGNTASGASANGGGIRRFAGGTINLTNALIAGNINASAPDIGGAVNFAASYNNLIGNGTGMTGISNGDAHSNLVGSAANPINPLLGLLQNNGGPTLTLALLTNSPAIDAGTNTPGASFPALPATDQRGFKRIVNTTVDIGAYEFQASPATTSTLLVSSLNPSNDGQTVTFTATVTGTATGSNTPTGTVTFSIDGTAVGAVTLVNGVATLTISSLGGGGHPVLATYNGGTLGDITFSTSTSNTLTQVVALTFGALTPAVGTVGVAYSGTIAIGNSPGPFTFVSSTLPPAYSVSISGSTITVSNANPTVGTVNFSVTIKDASNTMFMSGTETLMVNAAVPTHLGFVQQPTNTLSSQVITPAVTVQILDANGNRVTSDNSDVVTIGIASGPAGGGFTAGSTLTATASSGLATFANLGFTTPGTYTLSETVTGLYTGPVSNAFSVTPLQVSTFTQTSTGFTITFNQPFVASAINLYDGFSTFGPADVTLVGATNGAIQGSLFLNPSATALTFVATNGNGNPSNATLAPDTYTVTLRSASNAFHDVNGGLLDGNDSLMPGTNYVTTFTVGSSSAVVVTVPDFARGPGQPVNLPATGTGIPININNSAGVTSVSFTLTYDPTLLTITGGTTSLSNATLTVMVPVAGTALVSFSTTTALSGGTVMIGDLTATVPQTAPYQNKEILHFSNVQVNGGALASVGADALHVVAYLGDAADAMSVTAFDASLVTRVALGSDTGFAAYPNTDPHIIGDINGDGRLTAADATLLLRASVGTTVAQIPAIPTGFTIVQGGPDPTVSIPTQLSVSAAGIVTVPVDIDDPAPAGSTGMVEATLALTYDPSVLSASSSDIHLGSVPLSGSGWQLISVVDPSTGQIGITLYSTTAITAQTGGSLVTIDFHEQPGTALGPTPVALVDSVSPAGSAVVRTGVADIQGAYTLSPPSRTASNASLTSIVTVASSSDSAGGQTTFVTPSGQEAAKPTPENAASTVQTYQPAVLDQFFGNEAQPAKALIDQFFGPATTNRAAETVPLSLEAGLVMAEPELLDETGTPAPADGVAAPPHDLGTAERSVFTGLDVLLRTHSAWADAFASHGGGSGDEAVHALDSFFAEESGSLGTDSEDQFN